MNKILIAEDEMQNILLLKSVMKRLNFDPTVVNDGTEAVEILKKEEFMAVIMDISMPTMDGIEASRIVRSSDEIIQNNIPIILLSGNSPEHLQQVCNENDIDAFLSKPFRLAEMRETLAKVLE